MSLSTPQDKENVAALQKKYTDAAYLDQQSRPAHLVDHFIEVSLGLARKKTSIAQALVDGGIMVLLTGIRDGLYEYPDVPDGESLHVRQIIRQQMCTNAFAVFSERL